MTPEQCIAKIRHVAESRGMTVQQFAESIKKATPEDIALAMEQCQPARMVA